MESQEQKRHCLGSLLFLPFFKYFWWLQNSEANVWLVTYMSKNWIKHDFLTLEENQKETGQIYLLAHHRHLKTWLLTCAAAHVVRHDATEVPEARLAAIALLSPDARFTGALTGGWVTCPLVGAVDVTLTGTWGEHSHTSLLTSLCLCFSFSDRPNVM